ncbi:MAG: protein kinase [Aristaeellaceae bacterium]
MKPAVVSGVCQKCGQPALAPDSNGNALPLGTTLGHGRLTVGKVIGHGGFGVTYIAYSHKLQRLVALKEFMPEYMAVRNGNVIQPKPNQEQAYAKSRKSFLKEARALNELREHPNIVNVYSVFEENNTTYYTMELLEGETLLEYLKRNKKISGGQAFQMLYPIMDAIRFIHKKKILHRDISPGNIMLCRDPASPKHQQVKLIDFGAAHVAIEGYSMSYPSVKTNGYSPLEQNWAGNSQGPWMDVYSFCATVYSAVVGHVPPGVEARESALAEGREDPMKPPSALGGDISSALEDVLMRGLKLNYHDHIQSMGQLMQEVNAALAQSGVYTVPEPQTAEPAPVQVQRPRPAGRRVAAWLMEQVMLGVAQGMVLAFLADGLIRLSLSSWTMLLTGRWLVPFLLVFLGFVVLDLILLTTAGGTIGQLLFGIRVRDSGGYDKASAASCFVYALFYNTVLQLILGFVWLVSGKRDGPMERMLSLSVVSQQDAEASLVPETPVVKPVEPQHDTYRPQPKVPPAEPPKVQREPAQQGAKAILTCVGVSDDPQMQGFLHKSIALHDGDTLGKAGYAKYAIPAAGVSRRHCSFHYSQLKSEWYIQDEGSKNGTYVDGVRVAPQTLAAVKPGARIRLSRETFQIKY